MSILYNLRNRNLAPQPNTRWFGPPRLPARARQQTTARPSRPTAHDEGRPVRNGKYAWAPPKYYVLTASSITLFHQSKVL